MTQTRYNSRTTSDSVGRIRLSTDGGDDPRHGRRADGCSKLGPGMLVADVSENPSGPASLEKSIWSTSRGLRSPMSDATSSSLSCRAIGPSDTKKRESEPACTIGRKVS
jgi:hypothetical protein